MFKKIRNSVAFRNIFFVILKLPELFPVMFQNIQFCLQEANFPNESSYTNRGYKISLVYALNVLFGLISIYR